MQYRSHSLFRNFYFAFFLFSACARQGAPAGGPKDTTPPSVDTTVSTPNFSTRFDKRRIELKFDEWVVLSDAATQVVVSPPFAKRPEIVLKGKTVVVNFDKAEILRPNTTYTINFGSAVKDLHENNPAKDLRFIFSTGDFIDSLLFSGILIDAFTGEPVENISIMLYENFADSTIRKERPYYFSRTNKAGQYEFRNLRAGTFRVVGIDDADQNLKWDGENERIAFRDGALVVNDSLRGVVHLRLFKNRPKFRLVGQNASRYGFVKLGFSTPIDSFQANFNAPPGIKTLIETTPDSLLLWYDLPVDTAWSLVFSHPESNISGIAPGGPATDTISVKKISRSDFLKNHRLTFGDGAPAPSISGGRGKAVGSPVIPAAEKTITLPFSKPAILPFNFPVVAFDTSRWRLSADSSQITAFSAKPDSASPRRLILTTEWKQGKTYALTFLPGALTDFWGVQNPDTLKRFFNVLGEKQLGTLSLTLEKIRPGAHYVLQILNGLGVEEERVFMAESTSQKFIFHHLQVATYTARLIEDANHNGRWDTGDIHSNLQPELVFTKKLDALRANWELEVSFSAEVISEKKRK